MKAILEKALAALQENHQFHQDHDDHNGYPESDMEATNLNAIREVKDALHLLKTLEDDADPSSPRAASFKATVQSMAKFEGLFGAAELMAREVAWGHRHMHSDYLPQTEAEKLDWHPHRWVVTAMIRFGSFLPRTTWGNGIHPNEKNPDTLWAEIMRLRNLIDPPTAEMTLVNDPAMRAAVEAYHRTQGGHWFKLQAAVQSVKKPAETFEQVWLHYQLAGYQYGQDALDLVRFGYRIAHGERPATGKKTP